MAKEEMVGQIRGKDSRRLPLELAELLTPPLEHALNHALRREILRALNESGEPRSAAEIVAAGLPKTSVTLVNYHAGVLETCDLVRVVEDELAGESPVRRYASTVTDDVQVLAVLGATEALDRLDG